MNMQPPLSYSSERASGGAVTKLGLQADPAGGAECGRRGALRAGRQHLEHQLPLLVGLVPAFGMSTGTRFKCSGPCCTPNVNAPTLYIPWALTVVSISGVCVKLTLASRRNIR